MLVLEAKQTEKITKGMHGKLVYPSGYECPYCAEYCAYHCQWLKDNDYKIIPIHKEGKCAGFFCGHGTVIARRETKEHEK